eukprot:15435080-Alexandrium_andersonii.AAC.1
MSPPTLIAPPVHAGYPVSRRPTDHPAYCLALRPARRLAICRLWKPSARQVRSSMLSGGRKCRHTDRMPR